MAKYREGPNDPTSPEEKETLENNKFRVGYDDGTENRVQEWTRQDTENRAQHIALYHKHNYIRINITVPRHELNLVIDLLNVLGGFVEPEK